jgi:NADPH2:quinone reductase
VLVEAAGGGLGVLLVQLAARAGARVVGAAGGAPKRDLARRMGAEVVVDYRDPQWTDRVPGPVGLVYESVGGDVGAAALRLLADGGRLVVFGFASGAPVPLTDGDRRRVRVLGMGWSAGEMRAATAEALDLAVAGELTPVIGQRYPLDQAADAHRAIASRTTLGKTLLVVNQPATR